MKTKICNGQLCKGKEKSLSEFSKHISCKDRLRPNCKECRNFLQRQFIKKYPWKRIFNNVCSRCNNPKNKDYKNYGLRGIKCLITEDEIKSLWFRDKAYDMKKPSIDRKNSKKNYMLDNCQFIELRDNVTKANKESHIKAMLQFDLEGNFINEFKSITQASINLRINGSNITQCAKGKVKSVGGYKWKYKNE